MRSDKAGLAFLSWRGNCKVFQMGRARWPGTGTTRESTAQARPGPAACVPVPSTARPRARAWAANSAHGPARARHGKVAWPANGPLSRELSRPIPPDGLWPLDPGQLCRRVYKPAGLPRAPPTQTLNHFILSALAVSLPNALPPLLSGSRPLRRRWRRATAPPKGDGDSPSSPRTLPPLLVLWQPQLWSSDDAGNIPFCSSSSFSHCH